MVDCSNILASTRTAAARGKEEGMQYVCTTKLLGQLPLNPIDIQILALFTSND